MTSFALADLQKVLTPPVPNHSTTDTRSNPRRSGPLDGFSI
jgi:hypothetical protein